MTSGSTTAHPSPVTPEKIEHFIGGHLAPSVSGATFGVADPVSNQVYAQVAAGDSDDVDKAVGAATEAFKRGPWAKLAARARARVLNRIADGIEARGEQIAALETFDTGLPITQAKGQAARAAENFRYFADVIVAQHEEAFSQPGQLGYVLRRPAGVAGLITPWNTPFMLESWKLAPALASGCAVVLKPAEWTPLSASLLPEIMTEAGVPDGIFNIVHGIGEVAGAALVAHQGVPLISFTGETTTRQTIMREAADNLKGLIAWLKVNPGKASAGTAGVGATDHVGGVLFQAVTGTHFQFVPYRGAGPAVQDLVAGQMDIMFESPTITLPQVRSGQVKAFAVAAKSRLAAAPEIPTVDEAGLPGFYVTFWAGLWAPKGTPKDVIAKLNSAAVTALADPQVRSRFTDLGLEIYPRDQQTPEALAAYQKAEIEKWWPIIRAAGIKSE